MADLETYTKAAIEHIRYLSVTIGGRGSCTPHERRAAEYAAEQMREMGFTDVRLEPYRGAPSTYRPYAVIFGTAAASTLLALLFESPWMAAVAAIVNALGIWGMITETDFAVNWMRPILPKGDSQNAVGIIPAAGQVRNRVVLCAHVDSHRTPVFYSTEKWLKIFPYLVAGAFLSLVVGAVAHSLLAVTSWQGGLWIGVFAAFVQAFFVVLFIHADTTPFSPGANDNASGVGVVLGLAKRLAENPLAHTEVWLAFTGCEEAAAYGMVAFLDAHATELGDAVYIALDQVGVGRLLYLTTDGLIIKRKTHPRALDLARQAASVLSDLDISEQVGIAYTDAAVATKRGLIALTLDALPAPDAEESAHWHRMSDTLDHVDAQVLTKAHAFTWQILQEIDQTENRS
jgi:hypothetical protein